MAGIKIIIILLIFQLEFSKAIVEMTNFKCILLDKSFCNIDYCYIKAVNRSFAYSSLKIHVFKLPIHDMSLNLTLFKKANGYKPFLYDLKVDACAFLNGKRNVVTNYFYEFIEPFSNINHSCPYDHDIIVNKLDTSFVNNRFTNVLPMPEGEYAVRAIWNTDQIPRVEVTLYARVKQNWVMTKRNTLTKTNHKS